MRMVTTLPPDLRCPAPRMGTATTPVPPLQSTISSGARITTSQCRRTHSATLQVAVRQLCRIRPSSQTVPGSAAVPISVRTQRSALSATPAPRRLPERARNHHQQCFPGRNADDDAGRFPGICHRRVQLTTRKKNANEQYESYLEGRATSSLYYSLRGGCGLRPADG